ncbi:GbsR/MarR family transcriptional regulator [Bailinhaonella thermotolerans]|uniref:MarR family transcriptional regulator n=1 Tax=Bailinhaonella thermotolerans TaxID=1070861 RepID=A0A3A4B561_9ACTN|nr:MarR family transcriptional regulator [Bailinhaonella thermotolerans]RJL35750.1 MarR family transcriptional regulator [Bailinhaonella thermotolerans]
MTTSEELAFADRVAQFYAREYKFPPVTGRVLGYLLVCRPPDPSIDELSQALLASRSAITKAITQLTDLRVVRRSRPAGQRVDRITLDPRALDPTGFARETYQEQAALAREALEMLKDGPSERRSMLEEAAAFYDFLAERMPALLIEWRARRDARGLRH